MKAERAKTVAALAIMAGALLLLWWSLGQAPPRVDSRPHAALGKVLAEEALKLAGSGGRITLIAWDPSASQTPAAEVQAGAFHQALREAKATVSETNLIQQDPLRLIRVPPGDFLQIMRKQSDSDVIVSLLGPPVLNAEQRSRLGEKRPRIVAVCSGNMPRQINLRELFEENLLHTAIISRLHPGPAPASSGKARDWFDQLYEIVTPTSLAALPLPANTVAR